MVEGETVVITASILASQDQLNIYYVMLVTFLGTLIADQALFFVGKKWGKNILTKSPFITRKSIKIFNFLKKYNVTFILVFRFIYGIRTLSPIVIGMSDTSVRRFIVLNFISAIIWTVTSCLAGYFIGEAILSSKQNFITKILSYLVIVIFVSFFLHRIVRFLLRKYKNAKKDEEI